MAGMDCKDAIARCCCNQGSYQQPQVCRIAPWKPSVDNIRNEALGRVKSGSRSSRSVTSADMRRGCACTEVRWQPACSNCAEVLAGGLPREAESRFEREVSRIGGGPLLSRNGQCMMVTCVDSNNESHGDEYLHPSAPEENDCAQTHPPVAVSETSWLEPSADLFLQVGIFLFTAGVVDAGFSGDWSRIGVLSNEVEVELQIASCGIVPLAACLLWSIKERQKRM